MVVLALTQNSIVFILLDHVEGDEGITAAALYSLSEDTILVVAAKGIHEDVRLSRCHMYAATTFANVASLYL